MPYLDTGAMYRAVVVSAIRRGVDPTDKDPVAEVARDMELVTDGERFIVDGTDATFEIRSPEVSRAVSLVATYPEVREELRSRQRDWARGTGGGVVEGRDIGSVVFPDAILKVYLTADEAVRAARRSRELDEADVERIKSDIARRDQLDRSRADSPLVEPDGAVTIDTTDMTIDEVTGTIARLVAERS